MKRAYQRWRSQAQPTPRRLVDLLLISTSITLMVYLVIGVKGCYQLHTESAKVIGFSAREWKSVKKVNDTYNPRFWMRDEAAKITSHEHDMGGVRRLLGEPDFVFTGDWVRILVERYAPLEGATSEAAGPMLRFRSGDFVYEYLTGVSQDISTWKYILFCQFDHNGKLKFVANVLE